MLDILIYVYIYIYLLLEIRKEGDKKIKGQ